MVDIWPTVHRKRSALISDLSRLSSAQGSTSSICEGWTVHDVLAHLVDDTSTTKAGFVLALVRPRFNFDRLNQRGPEDHRGATPPETLAAFRNVHTRTSSAPAPLASRLVEVIVHGEDIRRPLGVPHRYPDEAVLAAMHYQLKTAGSMGGSRERANGIRLVAIDIDFSHGHGPEMRGAAIDLLLTLTGRQSGLVNLRGDGLRHWNGHG